MGRGRYRPSNGATYVDVLAHLEKDHRNVERLIAELEATTTAAKRVGILGDLGESLAKHMDVEEERLYPIVDRHLGAAMTQAATAEHDASAQ